MTTHDNAPPPEDWAPVRHCGLFCQALACEVCGEWVVPPNIELGQE